jgi:hypothetical protein
MAGIWVVEPCGPALKKEAVCSSKTTVSSCKPTRRYNSEDQHRHRRENLKSQAIKWDPALEQIRILLLRIKFGADGWLASGL